MPSNGKEIFTFFPYFFSVATVWDPIRGNLIQFSKDALVSSG